MQQSVIDDATKRHDRLYFGSEEDILNIHCDSLNS